MNLTGQLKILSDTDMAAVHEKILILLKEKGIVFQSDDAVETFRRHGAKISDHTVFFDKNLVETALRQCPSSFLLEAMDPAKNVRVGEDLCIHPAGGEVYYFEHGSGRRTPTLRDFGNIQRIYHSCENIDITGFQPLSPVDIPPETKGLQCLFESMKNSDKPIICPMELDTVAQKEDCLELFNIAYGKEDYLRDHYLTTHAVCSNSPFFYSDFACEGIRVYAKHRQPIIIVSAPMSGITSPVRLFATVIQSLAEMISGLVYAQLITPGLPVVMSASLTYGNLRYASWECAAPDTAMMLMATIQMFRDFYHLPARAQTGVTSSKCIDYQAGMETMQSFLTSALAGVQMTSQSMGSLGNLMAVSPEKIILDDELIGRVRYMLKGMDTDEEAAAMEEMMKIDPCGDFLTSEATMLHFRDGWQPTVSDWRSYDQWEQDGAEDVVEAAHRKVKAILAESGQSLLDAEREKLMTAFVRKKMGL